ncbi:MAG: electron transport complex subunit E [Candidatus Cloacimonadales bacterium]
MNNMKEFSKGLIKENPVFVMALGLCPTLGVTSSVINGIGMGLASTFVLVMANIIISLIKDFIPTKVRIPAYIVVIASFVTIVDMVMHAYLPALYKSLGLFIPLIVVNCIILGRAEAFAGKNKIIPSIFDGFGMGMGFTLALIIIAAVREILGNGSLLGFNLLPTSYQPMLAAILAPGAFLVMGLLMGLINLMRKR